MNLETCSIGLQMNQQCHLKTYAKSENLYGLNSLSESDQLELKLRF